jgi:aspartyl-tRNA(Asn)/glutamyl-tRNA(Gln) amidotransferase subunit A
MLIMGEWEQMSLARLGEALANGEMTSVALTERAIRNHEYYAESLGAYKCWDPEHSREQARAADESFAQGRVRGALQGIPISVKDLFGLDGYPIFAGSPRRLPAGWQRQGPVMDAVRRQLPVMMGKTHTVEFAFGGLGVNPHWGTPRNPWDPNEHRVPGGSSSGAGVSLCVGSAFLAFGTDTAGSVRIPASMTGNVGLKIGYGRWSLKGIVPLSPSLDTPGILARTVQDAASAFSALDPHLTRQPTEARKINPRSVKDLRLGVVEAGSLWTECSEGIAEGVRSAMDELARQGAKILKIPFPETEEILPVFLKGGIAGVEFLSFLSNELPDWQPLLHDIVALRIQGAEEVSALEYLLRKRTMERLSLSAEKRFRQVDALLCPTVAITPPTLEAVQDLREYARANMLALRNTGIVNYLNLCALTIPVTLDGAGMPVGMQLISPRGREFGLLEVGLAIEKTLGTSRERLGLPPALH